jgi:putative ABC transport system substrate-binding protein
MGLGREPESGLILMNDIFLFVHRKLINSLAASNKVPAIFFLKTEDGLMSYGVDNADLFEKAGGYIDRILRGAKPADLPVQVPTKYVLVVNLKTAKTLGLTIPESLMLRADEVIE